MVLHHVLCVVIIVTAYCSALFSSSLSKPEQVQIRSGVQRSLGKGVYEFSDHVQARIDTSLHVLAHHARLETDQQRLMLYGSQEQAIKVETEDLLVYADRMAIDTQSQIGSADQVLVQLDEGYFFAQHAHKVGPMDWELYGVTFTPCDAPCSHWSFQADYVKLDSSYLVKARNPWFYLGSVPIFGFPYLYMPLQGRSKSGFMIPRFRIDQRYGFGIRQEYYKHFSSHADMTIGVDWRANRGLVVSDQWRWGRGPGDFTKIDARFGWVRDELQQKHGKIFSTELWRYAVVGNDFRAYQLNGFLQRVASLARVDVGTDKRLDYQFFNAVNTVDDMFYNTLLLRAQVPGHMAALRFEYLKTLRRQFQMVPDMRAHPCACCTWPYPLRKRQQLCTVPQGVSVEHQDRAHTTYLPQLQLAGLYRTIAPMLVVKHDLMVDHMLHGQEQLKSVYRASKLVERRAIAPLVQDHLIRFNYQPYVGLAAHLAHNHFSVYAQPCVQVRTSKRADVLARSNVLEGRVFGKGGYRIFGQYGARWDLPECWSTSPDASVINSIQPYVSWKYTPKIATQHWYQMDEFDVIKITNQCAAGLRAQGSAGPVSWHLRAQQAYDFYRSIDRFALERGVYSKHLLPATYTLDCAFKTVSVHMEQEIELRGITALQSYVSLGFSVQPFYFSLGYLFTHRRLPQVRGLVNDVPHFLIAHVACPLGSFANMSYQAYFSAGHNKSFGHLSGLTPLLHALRVDYQGHCWGVSLGLEEKKYREYGSWRAERAVVFSLRLQSLGSFAQKFRQPFQHPVS